MKAKFRYAGVGLALLGLAVSARICATTTTPIRRDAVRW